jgi:ribonuclease P protein component
MVASRAFTQTVRSGRRAGARTLVLHFLPAVTPTASVLGWGGSPPRVGFVVGKAVGPAVTRNRVRRRLRHLAAERIGGLPESAALVVRALPAAAEASYAALGEDFDAALTRVAAASSSSSSSSANSEGAAR